MKCLRIVIDGEEHPTYPIKNAFERNFEEVETIWWQRWDNNRKELNRGLKDKLDNQHYDFVFMQIQEGGVIYPETLDSVCDRIPIFNWTGDVRNDLSYYTPIGKQTITLFSNNTDPKKMIEMGFRSDYLQTGYDTSHYYLKDKHRLNRVVFIGNNFDHNYFSQSNDRVDMVRTLLDKLPENFVAYGNNWRAINPTIRATQNKQEECEILNTALIAINIPHINCSRYYSDRQLRAMACGCLVLTQEYEDLEYEFKQKEHLDTWKDLDELIYKCNHYILHRDKAISIGLNSANFVREHCTWDYRMQELKSLINKYKK